MISVMNNNLVSKNEGYQNCNIIETLIFRGYGKLRKSLYTRVIIWVSNILNHIDTKTILPGDEDFYML